jgi:hypothetical protein
MATNPNTPDFTPAPSRKRIAGWNVERQFRFIAHLATFGSVTAAARSVGLSEASAWRLRARPGSESFAHAWDLALQHASAHLMGVAIERALHGARREYWKDGKLVGELVAPSDRLLMWAIDRLKPPAGVRRPTAQRVQDACVGFNNISLVIEDDPDEIHEPRALPTL